MFDESEDQNQSIPPNFVFTFKRYKWRIGVSICILLFISVYVVFSLPSTYRSVGLILVESQQIPEKLVETTVTSLAEERIKFIEQRVMTRDKLLAIARKYPDFIEVQTTSESVLVNEIRNSITIENITDGRGRGAATVAFTVAFESKNPLLAQAIANDLSMLFLDENIKTRTARAMETTDFLSQEAQRLKTALGKTERAISSYKQKYRDTLPEHLSLYMSMLERAQTKSSDLHRKLDLIKSQKSLLETQQDLASRPDSLSVDKLREEYQRLSLVYQPAHPDLIRLREAIKDAETEDSQKPLTQIDLGQSSQTRNKIKELDVEAQLISQDLVKVENEIKVLEAKIVKIPEVEQGMIALNRDYNAVRSQYEKLLANKMNAQIAENLEEGLKAERFSLLESPALPDKPSKPDRVKLLVGAFFGAIGIPFAFVALLALLDKSIRGEKAIEIITGQAPLAVIGYIETTAEMKQRAANRRSMMIAAPALLLMIALGIHFAYPQITTLLSK